MNSPGDNVDNANAMEEAEGAAALSEEDMQNLNTITDFDAAITDGLSEFLRIGHIPGDAAASSETKLILWLILEREFQLLDKEYVKLAKNNLLNIYRRAAEAERLRNLGGNVDAVPVPDLPPGPAPPRPFSTAADPLAGLTERGRRRTASHSGRARKSMEDLLRSSGFALPFDKLSIFERKSLFQQFSNSSVMLTPGTFSSVPEVFDALRTKSRIKEEFRLGDRLGGGNFGEVFAVTSRQSGTRYAAKRISLGLDCFEEMKMTLNESRILRNINHENIIQCVDAWLECDPNRAAGPSSSAESEEPLQFYVLLEFCSQSLSEWIIDVRKKPEPAEMSLIMKQTLAGVRYLHTTCRILHLDINTRNILWVDSTRTLLKITDFGLAVRGLSYPYATGTTPYAAPDFIFTPRSDIYSLGVTLLEVAENIATMSELVDRLEKENIRTEFPYLNNILPRVLSKHQNVRPSAQEFETMVNRVVNPTVRPVFELEPEDYRLVGPQPGSPPHPIMMEAVMEAEEEEEEAEEVAEEDEEKENESGPEDIVEEHKDLEDLEDE